MKFVIKSPALLCALVLYSPIAASEDDSWADRLAFSGDLRLRYEEIRQESAEKRDRSRYRARLKLDVSVAENVALIFQLASGADDPVSRNVTFGGGISADDIGFDLAYVEWVPMDGVHVIAGKMKNPLYRAGGSALVYDGDFNPEGLAVSFGRGAFFGNAGRFWVEERSDSGNSTLSALQLGGRFSFGENTRLTAGVGYFAHSNTVGNEPFNNGSPKGNTVDILGNYIYDYKNTEVFVVLESKIRELPIRVFVHSTRNNEVDEQDSGSSYGVTLGSTKGKGQWEAGITYQDIEADAVIGTFNDSDFGGGGTDATGVILKAKYSVSKNIFVGGTYFANEINPFSLPEEDYDRLQLDIEFKFK